MKSVRVLSGGAAITNYANKRGYDFIRVARWVQLAPEGSTDPRFDSTCRNGEDTYVCDFLGGEIGDPGTDVVGKTFNWSAFVQDSWHPPEPDDQRRPALRGAAPALRRRTCRTRSTR
jgi:hypothetical protein